MNNYASNHNLNVSTIKIMRHVSRKMSSAGYLPLPGFAYRPILHRNHPPTQNLSEKKENYAVLLGTSNGSGQCCPSHEFMKYWQRVDGLIRVHSVRSMGSYRFVVVVVVVVV